MTKDALPPPYEQVPLMRSTFRPRASGLPEVISFLDEANLIGPFCAHCGNPSMFHSTPNARCPRVQLFPMLPLPECGCHGTPQQARQDGRDPRTGRVLASPARQTYGPAHQ